MSKNNKMFISYSYLFTENEKNSMKNFQQKKSKKLIRK